MCSITSGDMYLISGCVILICLLESATVQPKEDVCGCPCPKPPPLNLTEDAVAYNCCNSNGRFRYTCQQGYVRKAGTSNMVKCSILQGAPTWTTPSLHCIPDPREQTSGEPGPPPGPPGQATSLITVRPSIDRTEHKTPNGEGVSRMSKIPTATLRASQFPSIMAMATSSPSHSATDKSLTQATSPVAQVEEGSGNKHQASPPPDVEERTSFVPVITGMSVLVLVICASAGLSLYFWKRRSSRPPQGDPTTPEQMPMNPPEKKQAPPEPTEPTDTGR